MNNRRFWPYIVICLILFLGYISLYNNTITTPERKVYSDLISDIKNEKISEIIFGSERGSVTAVYNDEEKTKYEIAIPSIDTLYNDVGDEITAQVEKNSLRVESPLPSSIPFWLSFLPTIGILIVIIIIWTMFQQSQGGGKGGAMSFGKSRAKLVGDDKKTYTFDDVAGADEEKEELKEIVDFLRSPEKYRDLGARIPRGLLLVGPPGTGKTLLAKAAAGEAGVPFFTISGSDFVEMFVGVGASRVRDLFEQAKKSAPCIIFIDEIDAVGRQRGAGLGGGHDEREQTLNQLLVEMDGFGVNENIIIVAATNRPDILDPALLRPGRFDRQVVVGVPDVKGREEILKVHAKNKPLDENVDLNVLAKTTVGFTGADLENLMNEGALLSARRSKVQIGMNELEESIVKVIAGPEKKTRVITEKERRLTAYHEAGHAIVAKIIPSLDNVHQVSIIPRGRAGGYTLSLPKEDKHYKSKNDMLDSIVMLLGGRVAEKLILDDISTGASNDIERATETARSMVTKYGMSDKLGPINLGGGQEVFIGRGFSQERLHSEQKTAEIDAEVYDIIMTCYNRCEAILKENMDIMHKIAEALLEYEKIDAEEFEKFFNAEIEEAVDEPTADIEKNIPNDENISEE